MKTLVLSILLLTTASCASAEWKLQGRDFANQRWRVCIEKYDGAEYHLKGLCRWAKETKDRFMRSDLQRRKHFFCAFTNKDCLIAFPLAGKIIQ
jgi:hypothetical protein